MRLIEKEMTDRFYDILEKHGNKTWAIDELEWLIDINYFNFTNDEEFIRAYKIIRILRNY
jgi:hypothetical protein